MFNNEECFEENKKMKEKLLDSLFEENSLRKEEYRKDQNTENIFQQMNYALEKCHNQMLLDISEIKPHPIIFVIGLPRSGTTFLIQLLSKHFDVGWINNLTARFWRVPVFGIELSKQLIQEKHESFVSFHGKTKEIAAPHEFAYFWQKWFNIEDLKGVDLEKIRTKTDWEGFKTILMNMAHAFQKPLLLKGIYPAYVLKKVHEIIPEAFFIYIKRNLLDVAVSLRHSRVKYYGSPEYWWSMYPPEYNKIKDKSWKEQIAGQVYYLNKLYDNQFSEINPNSYITVDYNNLCSDVYKIMAQIQTGITKYCNFELAITNEIPKNFEIKHSDRKFDGFYELENALNKYINKNEQKTRTHFR